MRRSDPDVFQVSATSPLPAAALRIIEALTPHVTAERRERIDRVVAQRTNSVALVVEDLADPHNVSAVLRSADAFGVQNIHVLPGPHGFLAAHQVSKGTHRWLTVHPHENPAACCAVLRAQGYALFVASMEGEMTPADLARLDRVAVLFGNEHRGPTPEIRALTDGTFRVPMRGFVESLNVSVAAAVTLYALTHARPPGLSSAEREELTARFLMMTVKNAEELVARTMRVP